MKEYMTKVFNKRKCKNYLIPNLIYWELGSLYVKSD